MVSTRLDEKTARHLTVKDLELCGRFSLRLLAQDLSMLDTFEARVAFLSMSNVAQAQAVYHWLHPGPNPIVVEMRLAVTHQRSLFQQMAASVRETYKYYRGVPRKVRSKR